MAQRSGRDMQQLTTISKGDDDDDSWPFKKLQSNNGGMPGGCGKQRGMMRMADA